MKKILLLDLPNIFYRAFFAVPQHFSDRDGKPTNAIFGTISILFSFLESEKPDQIFVARDCREKTFRHQENENYKQNREKTPDKLLEQLPRIFDFFENFLKIPILKQPGFEADDILGTIAEKFRGKNETEILVASADHDLFQLIGDNIFCLVPARPNNKKFGKQQVEEKIGVSPKLIPDFKSLAGDNSDNLSGVPGIGPQFARKILHNFDNLENALGKLERNPHPEIPEKIRQKLINNQELATQTKKLATILRDVPIANFSEKKITEILLSDVLDFLQTINFHSLSSRAKKIFSGPENQEQTTLF